MPQRPVNRWYRRSVRREQAVPADVPALACEDASFESSSRGAPDLDLELTHCARVDELLDRGRRLLDGGDSVEAVRVLLDAEALLGEFVDTRDLTTPGGVR